MLDVEERIFALKQFPDDWYDDDSKAPKNDFLDWFNESFLIFFNDENPLPYLYPTYEGNLRAEWKIMENEISLEINQVTKKAFFHSIDFQSGNEHEDDFDLNQQEDWIKLNSRFCFR